jgi:uncharacterized protein involved in exopolysaccharide biosynthesis
LKSMDSSSKYKKTSGLSQIIPQPIQQHSKLALSVMIAIFALTSVYSMTAYKPKYNSAASVVIKNSPMTSSYLTNETYATTTSSLSNPILNTMELLKSDTVARTVWQDVLIKHPTELQKLKLKTLDQWRGRFGDGKSFIKAKNIPGTDVIYLGFNWSDPSIAQEGMAAVLKAFMQASLEQNQSEHHQRFLYLTKQAADLKKRLFAIRENIALFKKTHDIYNLDSSMTTYEQHRSALDQSTRAAGAEAQNYENQLSAYESSLGMSPKRAVAAAALGRSSTLSQMFNKLYELTAERTSLQERYTPEHVKIKQLDSQISQMKKDIQTETARNGLTAKVNPTGDKKVDDASVIADETRGVAVTNMLEVQARFKGAKAQSAQLSRSLAQLESKMRQLPEAEATLMNLKQEETSMSNALDVLEQKALEAKMREMQTLSNVFPLANPSLPGSPQFPNRIQLMILGVAFGALGGIALAYMVYYLQQRQNRDEAEHQRIQSARSNASLEELLAADYQNSDVQQKFATNGVKD